MPLRVSIPKLSARGIAPLQSPRLRNELLQTGSEWQRKLGYLRTLYGEVYLMWKSNSNDELLYSETEPKLRELLFGLDQVLAGLRERPDVHRMAVNAQYDFEIAQSYGREENWERAAAYMSYALLKLSNIIDGLSAMAAKQASKHVNAYGYDISGQVFGPGERESRSPNLWDQANSPKNNKTPTNPANSGVDAEAESDFPELLKHKHDRVHWPARTR